jgi:hypothetical protein
MVRAADQDRIRAIGMARRVALPISTPGARGALCGQPPLRRRNPAMDGTDLQRRIGEAQKARSPRKTAEAQRRNQGNPSGATARDVLKAGRDPTRKFEALRRGLGAR